MADSTASTQEAQSRITISNWRASERKTVRGFFTLTLASGLVIHNCCLLEKNRSRWIGFPFDRRDGEIKPLIEFTSRSVADNFRRQVIDALKAQGVA